MRRRLTQHWKALSDLPRPLDRGGYRGDYRFQVFNADYLQRSPEVVERRAHRAVKWVTDQVLSTQSSGTPAPLRAPPKMAYVPGAQR